MRLATSIGFACLLAGPGCAPATPPPTDAPAEDAVDGPAHRLPGISGIAPLDGSSFIVVHDTKRDEDAPRLARLTLDGPAIAEYRPLPVDWQAAGGVTHDLESICRVPDAGPADAFLVLESGHGGGHTGRLLHLRLSRREAGAIDVAVAGRIDLPRDVRELEGATLIPQPDGGLQLALCERDERSGRKEARDGRHALIRWSGVDLDRHEVRGPLRPVEVRAALWPEGPGLRTCSEIHYAVDEVDGPALWIAATVDPGHGGPYDSLIYRAPLDGPGLEAASELAMDLRWRVRQHKVEGLAFSAGDLIVATDEDDAGGSVRRLPTPKQSPLGNRTPR